MAVVTAPDRPGRAIQFSPPAFRPPGRPLHCNQETRKNMESRSVQGPNHLHCREHFQVREGVGTLFVVGGAGTPHLIHEEFFRLAGGRQAQVLHIPSATMAFKEIKAEDLREEYGEFYAHEPESFDFLHTYDRAVAEGPAFARPLDGATGVWIGGGDQNRLAELFLDTEVVRGLRGVIERGGVVGGTSSGAAIASDAMICRGYRAIEFGRGFAGFTRGRSWTRTSPAAAVTAGWRARCCNGRTTSRSASMSGRRC